MLKKILSIVLTVAMLGLLSMVWGCEQNEYKSSSHTEKTTHTENEVVE